MDVKKEVDKVILELKSACKIRDGSGGSSSSLYGALIMMRTTLIKSKDALSALVQAGCVQMLLDLLTPPMTNGKWLKMADIIISILANVCLEEDVAKQVIVSKGLSVIVEVTASADKESIHNRGVRAVANLVQFSTDSQCNELFDLEFPAFVAKRLMETNDKECKTTYLRAIRLFGQTVKRVKKVIEGSRCVQAVAAMLTLTDEQDKDGKLKTKALRILSEFSALRCCPGFLEQILAANILEELVQAMKSTDNDISIFSLTVVLRLCEHEHMRPPLGAAGLIPILMELLNVDKDYINHVSVMNALCLCSKEAVNRHRLDQENTLELFISALRYGDGQSTGKFLVLHDRIISSLVNFLYHDECFGKLLDLGLVSILMAHLIRVCGFSVTKEDWIGQVSLLSAAQDKQAIGSETASAKDDADCKEMPIKQKLEEESSTGRTAVFTNQNDCKIINDEALNCDGLSTSCDDTAIVTSGNDSLFAGENTQESLSATLIVGGDEDHSSENVDQEMVDMLIDNSDSVETASRHVFSIDSPTYQMEQHTWRLEDHTSGITCKSYTPEHLQDSFVNVEPTSIAEGGKFSPFSPLSAQGSYYSPAYSSPAHSWGLSPKYSNLQSPNSYNAGSPSPQSSPAWSTPGSVQFDDNISTVSTSELGQSPNSTPHDRDIPRCQFSPLVNSFPASPPPAAHPLLVSIGENDLGDISPLYSYQMSFASDRSPDSTQDVIRPPRYPLFSSLVGRPIEKRMFTLVPLSQENDAPLYSASEEEEEEEEEDVIRMEEPSPDMEPDIQIEGARNMIDTTYAKHGLPTLVNYYSRGISPKIEKESQEHNVVQELSIHSPKKIKISTINESTAMVSHKIPPVKADSDPCSSVSLTAKLSKWENLCKDEQKKTLEGENDGQGEKIETEYQPWKSKGQDSLNTASIGSDSIDGFRRVKQEKTLVARQHSLPSNINKLSSSSSPKRSLFELSTESPSMSPFSRYNSPMASPNPHLQRNNGNKTTAVPETDNTASTITKLISTNSNNETSSRVKKILRTTESNILILLSRVSLKTNPTPFLVQGHVLSTLMSYLSITQRPFQRCIRTLVRLCSNPLCFDSLLIEQVPALIVKNLIHNQDGTFPAILFNKKNKTHGSNTECNSKRIHFDEIFPSSQNSDTASSDFGYRMDFEFGGDAYSRMMASSSTNQFAPPMLRRHLSLESQCARDNPEVYHLNVSENVDENRIKSRVSVGIGLMKALTSIALSRYGDGELQRILVRGTNTDKLACAISLLHMPIGCGYLHRHQIVSKYQSLHQAIPLIFIEEAPIIRESIVSALSLLAHLVGISKSTPEIPSLTFCPDSRINANSSTAHFNPHSHSHTLPPRDQASSTFKNNDDDVHRRSKKLPSSSVMESVRRKMDFNNSTHDIGVSITEENASKKDINTKEDDPRSGIRKDGKLTQDEGNRNVCVYKNTCDKYCDLNLIATDDRTGERKEFRASKETLMASSDVFSAMLGGGYAEADRMDIEFSEISLFGFEYILHYLHGCESGCDVIDSLLSPTVLEVAPTVLEVAPTVLEVTTSNCNRGELCNPEHVDGGGQTESKNINEIEGQSGCIEEEIITGSDIPTQCKHQVVVSGNSNTQDYGLGSFGSCGQQSQSESDITAESKSDCGGGSSSNCDNSVNSKCDSLHKKEKKTEKNSDVDILSSPPLRSIFSLETPVSTQSLDTRDDLSAVSSVNDKSSSLQASLSLSSPVKISSGFAVDHVPSTSMTIPTTSKECSDKDTTVTHSTLTSTTPHTNSSHSHTIDELADSVLTKCVDILTVADRFLLHHLTTYLKSVLSHHCLNARTSQDILYLASHYKMDTLVSDCVVELLLSPAARKDVSSTFASLGLDGEMKDTVTGILTQFFSKI